MNQKSFVMPLEYFLKLDFAFFLNRKYQPLINIEPTQLQPIIVIHVYKLIYKEYIKSAERARVHILYEPSEPFTCDFP